MGCLELILALIIIAATAITELQAILGIGTGLLIAMEIAVFLLLIVLIFRLWQSAKRRPEK